MNLKSIALSKVRKGDVRYALGRFKTVRVSYSALRKAQGALGGSAGAECCRGARRCSPTPTWIMSFRPLERRQFLSA